MTPSCKWPIELYYINTNEIRGELSRENMISSHVKLACYLHHPTRSLRTADVFPVEKITFAMATYTYEKVKWFGILSGVYIIFKVEQHMAP